MSKPLHIGQIVRVFDDRAWRRVGHDIGDNSRSSLTPRLPSRTTGRSRR